MAFIVGESVVTSFARYCGVVIGGGTVLGSYRVLMLSEAPCMIEIRDADDGNTVFQLNTPAPVPPGKPTYGDVVKVLQSPLAYIGLVPVVNFPLTLPAPFVGTVYAYVDVGGFGVYCILLGQNGSQFLALPSELSL